MSSSCPPHDRLLHHTTPSHITPSLRTTPHHSMPPAYSRHRSSLATPHRPRLHITRTNHPPTPHHYTNLPPSRHSTAPTTVAAPSPITTLTSSSFLDDTHPIHGISLTPLSYLSLHAHHPLTLTITRHTNIHRYIYIHTYIFIYLYIEL